MSVFSASAATVDTALFFVGRASRGSVWDEIVDVGVDGLATADLFDGDRGLRSLEGTTATVTFLVELELGVGLGNGLSSTL